MKGCAFMIYSDSCKKRMDKILEAFTGYIESQNYFDIIFSQKAGFLWIAIDPSGNVLAEPLGTPEKMMAYLFNDVITEIASSSENSARNSDAPTLTTYERQESYRRITAILETIKEGKEYYFSYLEQFIETYPKSLHKAAQSRKSL